MQRAPLDTPTLLRVRWLGTLTLGALVLLGALGVLPPTPAPVAAAVLAGACAVNLALHALGPRALGPALVADTGLITALLVSTGGATNPLTLLYLFPVILASLATSLGWTVALGLLTTAAFAALFAAAPDHVHHMDMRQHVLGMVVAYGVTVPLVAAAVHRFRQATALAEAEVARARATSERAARLASLAALAGGAAHEIATPLSTILLVARELQREAEPAVAAELEVIAEEVARCTEVLEHLSTEVGAERGERPVDIPISALVRGAAEGHAVQFDLTDEPVRVPVGLVHQALRRLLGNARDARPDRPPTVRGLRQGAELVVQVQDEGPGMDPATLAQACDPFFTTKRAGHGMGLGLFFVQSVATQLGGRFELSSAPGRGTTATLALPAGRP